MNESFFFDLIFIHMVIVSLNTVTCDQAFFFFIYFLQAFQCRPQLHHLVSHHAVHPVCSIVA